MKIKQKICNLLFYCITLVVFLLFQSIDMMAQVNTRDNLSPNFECLEFPSSYFIIDGRRYDSGQTAHICRGDDLLSIEVFHEDGTRFPDFTAWVGVEDYDGSQADFNHSMVSENTEGNLVRAEYHFSEDFIRAELYIVTVGVTFAESPEQIYGYDENLKPSYSSFYSVAPINENIGWKSIEIGKTDQIKVNISPNGIINSVFYNVLEGIDFSVSPEQATSNPHTTNILAGQTKADDILVTPIGDLDGCYSTPYTYISSYNLSSKELSIVVIHEENDDTQLIDFGEQGQAFQLCIGKGINNFRDTPDTDVGGDDVIIEGGINTGANGKCETIANNQNVLSDFSLALISNPSSLIEFVNNIYKQAVFTWEITILEETINFDLDRDGKLDTYVISNSPDGYTEEMKLINENCMTCNNSPNMDHFMFLHDYPSDTSEETSALGIAAFNYRYGFVFPKFIGNQSKALNNLVHELGHLGFGLYHPCCDPNNHPDFPVSAFDDANIMESSNEPNGKIRKYQWDLINPN